jgi:hypothetical protein
MTDVEVIDRDDKTTNQQHDSKSANRQPDYEAEKNTVHHPHPFSFGHSCKMGMIVSVMFVIIMSDVFIERVLGRISSDLVNDRNASTRGMGAQLVVLVMAMIVMDYLISREFV